MEDRTTADVTRLDVPAGVLQMDAPGPSTAAEDEAPTSDVI